MYSFENNTILEDLQILLYRFIFLSLSNQSAHYLRNKEKIMSKHSAIITFSFVIFNILCLIYKKQAVQVKIYKKKATQKKATWKKASQKKANGKKPPGKMPPRKIPPGKKPPI